MSEIIRIQNIAEYHQLRGLKTLHPLVSVFDLSQVPRLKPASYNVNLFAVFFKEIKCGELLYGRHHYDYQDGTLLFLSPGQVVTVPSGGGSIEPKGWALLFHPDLIKGTTLGKSIFQYSFFSYDVNEALHISEQERSIVLDCFSKILLELKHSIDRHSKKLITSNIEILLQYCNRFYERQFFTRENTHQGLLAKFETLLQNYYADQKHEVLGMPTVSYFAGALNLSANYFGDLIKKETGISPLEHIQQRIMDEAKEKVHDLDQSISQIAYNLGFSYPQHFARLFKQKVGVSPIEYRNQHVVGRFV
ncbi:MAG: helix-turn-helix domain-containing protein [Saprospiraceae bacterium]|jgi:AraC-like DNA-binding protein|nr:helix-turn-helix domain-containing protein [Saprospiraceae bacterium]